MKFKAVAFAPSDRHKRHSNCIRNFSATSVGGLTWCYVALVLLCCTHMTLAEPAQSIPIPTSLEELVLANGATVTALESLGTIEVKDTRLVSSRITLECDDEQISGLQIRLTSDSAEDRILLGDEAVSVLRSDFEGLPFSQDPCTSKRCSQGVARCWPGYPTYEPQRLCPEYYVTDDGETGVVISTPAGTFVFEAIEPASIAGIITQ